MKKYLSYILIGIVAVGCTTMYGPEQHPTPVVPSDGLELTLGEVKDSSVTVTIAPKGETSYYSYCVLPAKGEDATPEKLDSVGVYSLAYEGEAVQCGIIKWTAEKPKAEIKVEPLEPDGYYYFYAVAGSVEGVPSTVVSLALHTTDAVAPELDEDEGFETADSVVTLTFPETVTYNNEVKLQAAVYAINSSEIKEAAPIGVQEIPADSVKVKGNVVTITIPGLPDGALYALNLPEGTFLDSVDNKSKAVQSMMMLHPTAGLIDIGICGKVANKAFALEKLKQEYIHDFSAPILVAAADGRSLIYTGNNTVQASYKFLDKTTSYELAYGRTYGLTEDGKLLFLLGEGEKPGRGSDINLTVDAEVFEDVFGNASAAWKLDSFYAYEYKMDDIFGTFQGVIISQKTKGNPAQAGDFLEIAPLSKGDDEKKGNCKITSIYGFASNTLYANFIPERGTLSIDDSQIVTDQYSDDEVEKAGLLFLSLDEKAAPVVFNMYQPNTLRGPSVPFALFVDIEKPKPFDIVFAVSLYKK